MQQHPPPDSIEPYVYHFLKNPMTTKSIRPSISENFWMRNMSFSQKQAFAGRGSTSSSAAAASSAQSTAPVGDIEGYVTYTVRSGDTLWEIARKHPGVSETDIARLNGLSNAAKIQPGQVIRIKPKS